MPETVPHLDPVLMPAFNVPCWSAAMPLDATDRDALLDDLDRLPPDHHREGEPVFHTDHVLSLRSGRHWDRYRAAVDLVADTIADELGLTWSERSVFVSAIHYPSGREYPRTVGHAHVAATLVVAMPLRLPAGLAGATAGGTELRNPLPATVSWCGTGATWSLPAQELHALVFPGFVEHRPALPPADADTGAGRVLLTADVCYF